ncbi:hypothetical protein FCE95_07150 [Luteimonas gilva]|uniref:DUF1440 domain-containing protein n=1 Tax=Luteimonas gilva TaxID=2572684 RepID=A0A4U5K0D2_9GAMM|nr:hypothetical protein [Luteimonas gilva]TKR34037.1 hypothetical protein FCE95_07150 [Luteimonas gilva]
MNTALASLPLRLPAAAWTLLGAVIATALDLTFAAIYWELAGSSSTRVMQAIAAYWGWGRDAYAGGMATAVLGMALFFGRMILLAALYRIAARPYPALIERPYLWGALFGLAVFLTNHYLVVPLIASMPPSTAPTDWLWQCSCAVAHMVLIGVPLALSARIAIAAADSER